MERGERVADDAIPLPLLPLFGSKVQGFVIDLLRTDPAALLGEVDVPVLVVHGAEDAQVGFSDAERLRAAGGELAVIPQMSHVLKRVDGMGRAASLATYLDPNAPLAPGSADAIASFLREAAPAR